MIMEKDDKSIEIYIDYYVFVGNLFLNDREDFLYHIPSIVLLEKHENNI
jgi:hypothetical protein